MRTEAEQRLNSLFAGDFSKENLGVEALKDLGLYYVENQQDLWDQLVTARMFLLAVFEADQDALEGYFGIEIMEKCAQRPEGEDCFGYLFSEDSDPEEVFKNLFSSCEVTTEPTPGAIAVYMDATIDRPLHVGKVADDGKVVSKWGVEGHVFKHPPHLVPNSYGSLIAYLR